MKSIGLRYAASGGAIVLLAVAALTMVTGSSTVRDVHGSVTLVGDQGFDLEVAGINAPTLPSNHQWRQGLPDAIDIALVDPEAPFVPGDRRTFTIGARNSSAELAGDFQISLIDRHPEHQTMFNVLEYTLRVDGVVLVEAVPGADIGALTSVPLGRLEPGEFRDVVLEMHYPPTSGVEYQGLGVWMQVRIDGENL